MSNQIRIGGVCERDLDLFLQEQFISSPEFCVWFAKKAGLGSVFEAAAPAKRSKTDRTGESDIEVMLNVDQALPVLLLIENKITASFQPMQAERYRDRGNQRLKVEKIADYRTVLVSPENYFPDDLKGFHARVSFEEIKEFLSSTESEAQSLGDKRLQYKVALLDDAIKRFNTEGKKKTKPFTRGYWSLISEIAPEFMRKKLPPEIGDTMLFVDSRPATGILPSHRLAQGKFGSGLVTSKEYGNFDILIERSIGRIDEIKEAFKDVLLPHIEIVPAGGSVAFRIAVPRILKADQVSGVAQVAAARTAIYLGKDLYCWFLEQRQIWEQFVPQK